MAFINVFCFCRNYIDDVWHRPETFNGLPFWRFSLHHNHNFQSCDQNYSTMVLILFMHWMNGDEVYISHCTVPATDSDTFTYLTALFLQQTVTSLHISLHSYCNRQWHLYISHCTVPATDSDIFTYLTAQFLQQTVTPLHISLHSSCNRQWHLYISHCTVPATDSDTFTYLTALFLQQTVTPLHISLHSSCKTVTHFQLYLNNMCNLRIKKKTF